MQRTGREFNQEDTGKGARTQAPARTLKERILGDAPIIVWMARWAAERITKHLPGDDGRTPFERTRLESCAVPFVPFGETAMYLQLQIAQGSEEPVERQGVWLQGEPESVRS